jgi:hypothetical protein
MKKQWKKIIKNKIMTIIVLIIKIIMNKKKIISISIKNYMKN